MFRQFTGLGIHYNIICKACANDLDNLASVLSEVSAEQFAEIDTNYCEGVIGEPEVFERETDLQFVHEIVSLNETLQHRILDIVPQHDVNESLWIAVLSSAEIIQINLSQSTVTHLAIIPDTMLQLAEQVALHISQGNQFAAVVNNREESGVVVNLSTGDITMSLNRGTYHPEQTPFPVAFFQSDDKTLLVHGTAWNRLDISNPETGQLLTNRIHEVYDKETRPEHYLDYFHSHLLISPDAQWIAEDGWVWHPCGVTRFWNLQQWLTQNLWESEDGETAKNTNWRWYYWNAPLCWIDNQTIAVWGFGSDDLHMTDAVKFFDVVSGKEIRWFAGPKQGDLYFDVYLFSISKDGVEVWDIETGERLLSDRNFVPIRYHQDTREFLSLLSDGQFQLSKLS